MRYFFLVLFLIPSFAWSYFDLKTCEKNRQEAVFQREKSQEFIQSINAISLEQKIESLPLFHLAIYHIDQAYGIYNEILYDITMQKNRKIKKKWHEAMQKACEVDRDFSLQKLQELRSELCNREWIIHAETLFAVKNKECYQALETAKEFYQQILPSMSQEEQLPLLLQASSSIEKVTASYEELLQLASTIGNEIFRSDVLKEPIEAAAKALATHQEKQKELENTIIKTRVFILDRESFTEAPLATSKEPVISKELQTEEAEPTIHYGADIEELLYVDYNLIEKIKAFRHKKKEDNTSTCYEYDTLDRTGKKNIENQRPSFTFEEGRLLATITSPSSDKIKRQYTQAGLLKEEIYPDGTKLSFSYDTLDRLIQKEETGLVTTFLYDDEALTMTKTLQDKVEVSQFDVRGNLLTFTNALGNVWEKTYDDSDRLISEKTPSNEETTWSYQEDLMICLLPNKETEVTHYEMGRAVEYRTYDPEGDLLELTTFSYDKSAKLEKITCEDISQIAKKNTLEHPLEVLFSSYQYDLKGNCVSYTDGEDHTTIQQFDNLGRIIEKKLPDGALITYIYDADSNLIECHMPNDLIWKASYDLMGRTIFEELVSKELSSQRFIYAYEKGLLQELIDPFGNSHKYFYDSYHRLIEEHVDGHIRLYTYDLLDRITSIGEIGEDTSLVTEDYEALQVAKIDLTNTKDPSNFLIGILSFSANLFQHMLC